MTALAETTAEILWQSRIFRDVDRATVAEVIRRLPVQTYQRGHTVFTEGEPGDRAYIIVDGKVKIGRPRRTAGRTS